MRAVLTNFGTSGDVQPLLALAVELSRHGHQPVMALSPSFASRVEQLGLGFRPLGPDLQDAQKDANLALIATPDSIEQMRSYLSPLASALPQIFNDLYDACRDADVLISGPIQPASRMVHEITGIPFVSIQLAHFVGGGPPAIQQVSADLINPFRERLGLSPLRDPLTVDANSPQLALYAMSRHVRPRQTDWPPHYHLTGFFFLNDEDGQHDPALTKFLSDGEPPVVVTFGNMPSADPAALTDIVVEAVNRVNRRVIIPQSWVDAGGGRQLPSNVFAVGYVSHGWLFPQAACIVHHGGGTAGASFRSGVPSIFVPYGHVFDQYYWAELAQDLGCAGPPIHYPQLTADTLSNALATTLNTPRYYEAAAALGAKIQAEQGVKKARLLIEQLVQRSGWSRAENYPHPDETLSVERDEKMARRKDFQQQQRTRRKNRPATVTAQSNLQA